MFKRSYTLIVDLFDQFEKHPEDVIGREFTFKGTVMNSRDSKKMLFIELVDGSTIKHLQAICDYSKFPDNHFERLIKHAYIHSTVKLVGKIVKSPAKGQPIELQVLCYELYGDIANPESYQLASKKDDITFEVLRSVPHLRPKTKTFMAIQLIKKCVYNAMHAYFNSIGFGEVQPTLITGSECEGGAQMFSVTRLLKNDIIDIPTIDNTTKVDSKQDFFNKETFLTESSQLNLEATACATGDSYCMTTACRAEPSTGPLHLAEFCMPEYEMRFCELSDNMAVAEGVIKYCIQKVLDKHKFELDYIQSKYSPGLFDKLTKYAKIPFVVSSHQECITLMLQHMADGKVKFEVTPAYDEDLTKEHERYITENLFNGNFVFCCSFPKAIKPFYMPVIDKGAKVEHVDNYDLLCPFVGEVVGGSQRIWKYDELIERMQECGIKREPLEWYVDLRKYGSCAHGGAGIGMGRLILVLLGFEPGKSTFNIRDTQEFPRSYGTCLC